MRRRTILFLACGHHFIFYISFLVFFSFLVSFWKISEAFPICYVLLCLMRCNGKTRGADKHPSTALMSKNCFQKHTYPAAMSKTLPVNISRPCSGHSPWPECRQEENPRSFCLQNVVLHDNVHGDLTGPNIEKPVSHVGHRKITKYAPNVSFLGVGGQPIPCAWPFHAWFDAMKRPTSDACV